LGRKVLKDLAQSARPIPWPISIEQAIVVPVHQLMIPSQGAGSALYLEWIVSVAQLSQDVLLDLVQSIVVLDERRSILGLDKIGRWEAQLPQVTDQRVLCTH
jgi:hypothetical protein